MRLEPIDPEHPETVALMRGPLVLFAVTEQAPKVTGQQLLAAGAVSGADPGGRSGRCRRRPGRCG